MINGATISMFAEYLVNENTGGYLGQAETPTFCYMLIMQ